MGGRGLHDPQYHVFEMYKVHQGQTLIPVEVRAPHYTLGERSVPMLHASASRGAGGKLHLSLVNLHPSRPAKVTVQPGAAQVEGRLLTAPAMNAHNTFDQGDAVKPVPFDGFSVRSGSLGVALPPKSVVVLALQ